MSETAIKRNKKVDWSRTGILVILLLLVVLGFSSRLVNIFGGNIRAGQVFLATIHRFVVGFERIFLEALPFMLVGSLAAAAVELYFTKEDIQSILSINIWKAIGAGLAAGILLPLGDVGGIILGRSLLRKGASLPAAAALMISAASANLVSLGAALGSKPVLIGFGLRAGIGIIFAVLFALFLSSENQVAALVHRNSLYSPQVYEGSEDPLPPTKIHTLGVNTVHAMLGFMPFLIGGALVSGFIQAFLVESIIPPFEGPFVQQVAFSGLWGILSSGGNAGDLFAVVSWNLTRFSSQGLMVLLAGAFCDLKTIGLYLRVFKTRTIFYMVVFALGVAIMSTLLFGLGGGSQ